MKLIDADALLDAISVHLERIEQEFDDVPTIDAVEVVHCKDCKHRDPENKICDCGNDIVWQLQRDDDWYCADGERTDNETD